MKYWFNIISNIECTIWKPNSSNLMENLWFFVLFFVNCFFFIFPAIGWNRSEKIRKNTRLPKFFITSSISLYEKYSHKIPTSISNTISSCILCMETLRCVQIEKKQNKSQRIIKTKPNRIKKKSVSLKSVHICKCLTVKWQIIHRRSLQPSDKRGTYFNC